MPGLEPSQHRFERVLEAVVPSDSLWLDVGCGRRLLPQWRLDAEVRLRSRARMLVGIDLDSDSLRENKSVTDRCFGGVPDLPFKDGSFRVVTANMVVEHIADPKHALSEIRRVLQKDGVFIFHTPNAAGFPTTLARKVPEVLKAFLARVLDGRKGGDVFPTFYRANTPDQIRHLAREVGLELERMEVVSTSAMFGVMLPLALVELLWLRHIQRPGREHLRSNVIVVLRKTHDQGS